MDLQMPLVMLEETLSSVTVSSFSVVPQNRLDPALMMNANCSTPQRQNCWVSSTCWKCGGFKSHNYVDLVSQSYPHIPKLSDEQKHDMASQLQQPDPRQALVLTPSAESPPEHALLCWCHRWMTKPESKAVDESSHGANVEPSGVDTEPSQLHVTPRQNMTMPTLSTRPLMQRSLLAPELVCPRFLVCKTVHSCCPLPMIARLKF